MSSIGDDAEVEVQEETKHAVSGSEYEDGGETKREEVDDSEDSGSEREGRFHGPDSSWRFYTKGDRAIASSLDQAENNDLSAHLYNAHAWKQALRDTQRMKEALPWHGKYRWIKTDDAGTLPFLPPASWTAWPLRPEDVPRSQEQWGIPAADSSDEADTFTKRELWRPGLYLHEELKATFACRAKEDFREREQALTLQKQTLTQELLSETPISTKSKTSRSDSEQSEDSDESNDDQMVQENIKKEEEDDDNAEVVMESVSEIKMATEEYVSSFVLDDDRVNSILEPTIHHITARFDDLLVGLHKSRIGHRQGRSASRGSSAGSRVRSKSREHQQGAASVPSKRKRAVSDIKLEQDSPLSEDFGSEGEARPGRDSQRGSRRRMPAPRDWSEVLGVAAMVGWDQDILDRAARRCATIFGEGMTLRVMPETGFGHARDQAIEYVPEMLPLVDDESSSWEGMTSEEQFQGPPDLTCPDQTCRRHREPFSSAWRLRGHLKKTHKLTREVINGLVPRASTPEPRATITKTDQDSAEEKESASNIEDVAIDNVQDVAAVRRDGFLQPIDIRPYRSKDKQPRTRRTSRPKSESSDAE